MLCVSDLLDLAIYYALKKYVNHRQIEIWRAKGSRNFEPTQWAVAGSPACSRAPGGRRRQPKPPSGGTLGNTQKKNRNPERSERVAEALALVSCVDFCRPVTTFGAPVIFILTPGSAAIAAPPGAIGYHPLKRVSNSASQRLANASTNSDLSLLLNYANAVCVSAVRG